MADEAGKQAESAEKAYAAAAAAATAPKAAPVTEPVEETKPVEKEVEVTKKAVAEKKPATAKKAVAKKAAPKPAPAVKVKAAKPAPKKTPVKAEAKKTVTAKAKKPAPAKTPSKKPVTQVKEPIMAKTPDFMKTMSDAMADMQSKAKEAYEKGTAMTSEASEFAKGNVEAMVESGKIFSAGMQDMGKTYVDEAKSAFETITADMKEIAAIKSPTELFQLQGKLMRRNFDSMVAFSSKSSEAAVKLANDAIAPLSSRMSTAAEKISKVA